MENVIIRGRNALITLRPSDGDWNDKQRLELHLKQYKQKTVIPMERLTFNRNNETICCELTNEETSMLHSARYLEVVLVDDSYLSDYPKVICSMDYTVKDVLF